MVCVVKKQGVYNRDIIGYGVIGNVCALGVHVMGSSPITLKTKGYSLIGRTYDCGS